MSRVHRFCKIGAAAGLFALGQTILAEDVREFNFEVTLDDKVIGYHDYVLHSDDGVLDVKTDAQFDVRILFFTAYRYRHQNHERWDGECLLSVESVTDANGKAVELAGQIGSSSFNVRRTDGDLVLPACISSFAYWDQRFLQRSQLLNPQTGDYVAVTSEFVDRCTVDFAGKAVSARHYRLSGDKIRIDLWYSDDGQWLGLESVAKGDRVIRYRRI